MAGPVCLGLVAGIHLLPPWRSASTLNSRLVASHLAQAAAVLQDIAALLESSAQGGVAAEAAESGAPADGLPAEQVQLLSKRCMQQLVRNPWPSVTPLLQVPNNTSNYKSISDCAMQPSSNVN